MTVPPLHEWLLSWVDSGSRPPEAAGFAARRAVALHRRLASSQPANRAPYPLRRPGRPTCTARCATWPAGPLVHLRARGVVAGADRGRSTFAGHAAECRPDGAESSGNPEGQCLVLPAGRLGSRSRVLSARSWVATGPGWQRWPRRYLGGMAAAPGHRRGRALMPAPEANSTGSAFTVRRAGRNDLSAVSRSPCSPPCRWFTPGRCLRARTREQCGRGWLPCPDWMSTWLSWAVRRWATASLAGPDRPNITYDCHPSAIIEAGRGGSSLSSPGHRHRHARTHGGGPAIDRVQQGPAPVAPTAFGRRGTPALHLPRVRAGSRGTPSLSGEGARGRAASPAAVGPARQVRGGERCGCSFAHR